MSVVSRVALLLECPKISYLYMYRYIPPYSLYSLPK